MTGVSDSRIIVKTEPYLGRSRSTNHRHGLGTADSIGKIGPQFKTEIAFWNRDGYAEISFSDLLRSTYKINF